MNNELIFLLFGKRIKAHEIKILMNDSNVEEINTILSWTKGKKKPKFPTRKIFGMKDERFRMMKRRERGAPEFLEIAGKNETINKI